MSQRGIITTGRLAIAFAVPIVVGCYSSRAMPTSPHPGAGLTVSYESPREVVGQTRAGTTVHIAGVTQLSGELVRAGPDTLYLRVEAAKRVRGSTGPSPLKTVVAVAREPGVTITEAALSKKKTFLAIGVLTIVVLGALVAAVATADFNLNIPSGIH